MSSERILVVDDGADMRDFVINYILQPNGFSYMEARDGLEAFDLILADPPDLILLDLQMPRLDGVGLLSKMK
ncbi:MAG: response regulator, partial [Hyphomicrobiaceae bacterium]